MSISQPTDVSNQINLYPVFAKHDTVVRQYHSFYIDNTALYKSAFKLLCYQKPSAYLSLEHMPGV